MPLDLCTFFFLKFLKIYVYLPYSDGTSNTAVYSSPVALCVKEHVNNFF